MQISVEIDEMELRMLVLNRMRALMPDESISESDIKIEVKSKQNYRSEWESASFRARVVKDTLAPI